MKTWDRRTLRAFFLATAAGAALHFLYALAPCWITAFFAPVNESVWEHGKLVYWPALAALLLLSRRADGKRAERCAGLLLAFAGVQLLGWLCHGVLGGGGLFVDAALYVAMMAAAFLLPERLTLGAGWTLPLTVLTALLGAAVLLFTLLPPDLGLFADPALADAWYRLPC